MESVIRSGYGSGSGSGVEVPPGLYQDDFEFK